jgi:hypothetical protein
MKALLCCGILLLENLRNCPIFKSHNIFIFEDDQVLLEYVDESIEENWTWKLMVYDSKNDIIKFMEFAEYESTLEVCVESLCGAMSLEH